ncbi:MAG: hypothetical protein RL571_2895 [Pseudomonadota bacterium]|jgi:hypothetical protein
MNTLGQNAYSSFLIEQLQQLISKDSFTWQVQRQLAAELDGLFSDYQTDITYTITQPSQSLYNSIISGWLLDTEWLANENNEYFSDEHLPIEPTLSTSWTGVELLAAYGLYLVIEDVSALGAESFNEEGLNEQGWSKDEIIEWQTGRYFEAGTALALALKLKAGITPTQAELEQATRSKIALQAAEKRHNAPNGSRAKKEEILLIWSTGKYQDKGRCAEQECDALGIAFGTARKHLRNALNPNPWPARTKKAP